jgi:hypothetical protein
MVTDTHLRGLTSQHLTRSRSVDLISNVMRGVFSDVITARFGFE